MTRIRPISAGELPAFASAAGAEHAADQHTYLARLLEQGATRTEWCYLAEDHGRNLGRVALWTLPTLTRPESVILLDSNVLRMTRWPLTLSASPLLHHVPGSEGAEAPL